MIKISLLFGLWGNPFFWFYIIIFLRKNNYRLSGFLKNFDLRGEKTNLGAAENYPIYLAPQSKQTSLEISKRVTR